MLTTARNFRKLDSITQHRNIMELNRFEFPSVLVNIPLVQARYCKRDKTAYYLEDRNVFAYVNEIIGVDKPDAPDPSCIATCVATAIPNAFIVYDTLADTRYVHVFRWKGDFSAPPETRFLGNVEETYYEGDVDAYAKAFANMKNAGFCPMCIYVY